jgi:hypothetical protein
VAIETIVAWLDAGQPEPAMASSRVRQAVMGGINATVSSDVDCSRSSLNFQEDLRNAQHRKGNR